ncbi:MAG: DUF502 domain-containing protein [Halobacteria archaeon]|nr:DUF502 domain-containing protein [Halobacteria archaeon]
MAPLVVTLFVLNFVFRKVTSSVQPVLGPVVSKYTGEVEFVSRLLSLVVLFVSITLFGLLIRKGIGDDTFRKFEETVNRLPVVNSIYSGVREVSESFVDSEDRFDKVVSVDWPTEDLKRIGFVTGEAPEPLQSRRDETVYNVFMPMSPNSTAGVLLSIPEGKMEEIEMSVEAGTKMILTSGIMEEGEEDDEFINDLTDS